MDRELSPHEVAQLAARSEVQLIDVRETEEWDAGRLAGSRHVILSELSEQAATIDQGRPVIFVCRSGGRSSMATEAFAAAGYDAHNLTGGLQAWVAAGLGLDPADGEVR